MSLLGKVSFRGGVVAIVLFKALSSLFAFSKEIVLPPPRVHCGQASAQHGPTWADYWGGSKGEGISFETQRCENLHY